MISCANHDYVEIACMYRLHVKIVSKNAQTIIGIAIETTFNKNREECVVLETTVNSQMIVLDQIATMEAVTRNLHFDKINLIKK